MGTIKLVAPSKEREAEALAYRQEHYDYGEAVINGSSLFDTIGSYDEWLAHVEEVANEETAPPGWVASSVFFGVRESDNRIVGIIDLRHRLNDFLRAYGGHVGYSVRPTERRRGYATAMLCLGLDFYRELGLEKVMLCCYKDNLASIRTIEKCGGVLEREALYADGKPMLVYWVSP